MYKYVFGNPWANRGIEYSSLNNKRMVAALWGHPGSRAKYVGATETGDHEYQVTCKALNGCWLPVHVILVDMQIYSAAHSH